MAGNFCLGKSTSCVSTVVSSYIRKLYSVSVLSRQNLLTFTGIFVSLAALNSVRFSSAKQTPRIMSSCDSICMSKYGVFLLLFMGAKLWMYAITELSMLFCEAAKKIEWFLG